VSDRLADIDARIDGIRQLGAVVNAMRGIAAARAQQARAQLAAVDGYAATIVAAIGRALAAAPQARADPGRRPSRPALVVFVAEQGFAGAFSERVLDSLGPDLAAGELFLIGDRGRATAAERGVTAGWNGAMPAHSNGVPRLAGEIAEALYRRIARGEIDRLDAVFSQWLPGHGVHVERRRLVPFDLSAIPRMRDGDPPLLNLEPVALLGALTADYVYAQLCNAALHAFAAENEARMEAMAAARGQIERQLAALQATQRQVRQEEITAEIIELAAGETASRSGGRGRRSDEPAGVGDGAG
jgi:F-type H+-transporting ATPase subunit gamma